MSIYSLSQGIDFPALVFSTRKFLGRNFIYDGNSTTIPTEVEFIPDLTLEENAVFLSLINYCSSLSNFNSLPNWTSWTAEEAETNITNSIFSGAAATTVKNNIASQITAAPNTIAGVKTVMNDLFGQTADAIITIRSLLVNMGKAIIYLRNILIKLR